MDDSVNLSLIPRPHLGFVARSTCTLQVVKTWAGAWLVNLVTGRRGSLIVHVHHHSLWNGAHILLWSPSVPQRVWDKSVAANHHLTVQQWAILISFMWRQNVPLDEMFEIMRNGLIPSNWRFFFILLYLPRVLTGGSVLALLWTWWPGGRTSSASVWTFSVGRPPSA